MIFNTFFSDIVPNLNIDNNLGDNITNPSITDPVFCGIKKYESYRGFFKIKEIMVKKSVSVYFKFIDRKIIFNELQKLKSKNACQGNDIPIKIIKENINIAGFIYSSFNNSLFSSSYQIWKVLIITTPVFLKEGLWKRWNLLSCKHRSKSLSKVYVWFTICVIIFQKLLIVFCMIF